MDPLASRRAFLRTLAFGAGAFFTTRGAFAEELFRTPRVTVGPFYPDKLPLGNDNDLVIANDSMTPAIGEITHVGGRVLDPSGRPIFTTQLYIKGHPGNERDGIYRNIGDARARASVTVDFVPVANSRIGELA